MLRRMARRKTATQPDILRPAMVRHIRELGLVKMPEGYRQVEAPAGPGIESMAADFLWDAVAAQNLLVLNTAPGHANSLAISLDQEDWPEVVGLYDVLLRVTPSPIIELNRAVAVAMRDGED